MPRGVSTKRNETPEEREARIVARRAAEDARLRKSLLMNAETALKRSRRALDEGNMDEHVKWFGIAVTTLTSYEGVTGDAVPNGSTPQA